CSSDLGPARVVLRAPARPSFPKEPAATATRRGRYSGDDVGPLTASVRAWARMMAPSMRSARPALSAWRRIPGPPRDLVRARLLRLYRDLLRRFGPQKWWPGRSAFEIAVGAILTQH